jgi:predicted phosphodiesterase
MATRFRLVHLSDLHFATRPNRLPAPLQTGGLKALFDAAIAGHRGNWFKPATHSTRAARAVARFLRTKVLPEYSPDRIVVSGDLAATGNEEDLAHAHAYLISSDVSEWANRDAEPRLGFDAYDLKIVPGNHDRYHRGTLFPGAEHFDRVFAGLWQPTLGGSRVSAPQVIVKGEEKLALIAADFTFRHVSDSLPSMTGYIGRGRVYQDVLDELVAQTRSLSGAFVVWVVHYPPSFPGVNPNLELQGEQLLIQAAQECGVRLLLAGHTHDAKLYTVGNVVVSCVGSATQNELDCIWHFSLTEFDVAGSTLEGGRVVPFAYDKGRSNFVEGLPLALL